MPITTLSRSGRSPARLRPANQCTQRLAVQGRFFAGCEGLAQTLDDLPVVLLRPQMAQRLNDHSFGASGTGQGARFGMAQLDGLSANLNATPASIREIDGVGRDLRGKP